MRSKLQQAWFSRKKWIWCLFPFTLLFWALSSIRRALFRYGILKSTGAAIPVVVVGNIGIGGNGKTPLVLALIKTLGERGYTPAVLSRGYGGSQTAFPYAVNSADEAHQVGDEPALISKRGSCAVVIDPVRARGLNFIEHNTNADVVICDDGLQHYAMKRDLEICVLDKRGVGNGYLLPMGPLREGEWRLNTVNAIVYNMGSSGQNAQKLTQLGASINAYEMTLQASNWVNVLTQEELSLADFSERLTQANANVTALAGIGDPKRFFDTLNSMQLKVDKTVAFPDHHQFISSDLPAKPWVLMTEKDAVKCVTFAHANTWYLRIDAQLNDAFYTLIENGIQAKVARLAKIRAKTPQQ